MGNSGYVEMKDGMVYKITTILLAFHKMVSSTFKASRYHESVNSHTTALSKLSSH